MKCKVLLIMMLALVGGCDMAMVEKSKLDLVADNVALLSGQVDIVQVSMVDLAEAGVTNAEETKRVNENIDEYQEALDEGIAAFREAPTVIEGAIVANQASAPVNPYAPIIDAVLKILAGTGVVGMTYGAPRLARTIKEKNEVVNKYSAAKIGMDTYRNENPTEAPKLFKAVGDARKAKKIV